MSVYQIPTFPDPYYTTTVDLDGTDYALEFRFNQRENCWYFSVATSEGVALASGVKVVCNFPLLQYLTVAGLPPGMLMAISSTADTSPAGLNDLAIGQRVTLTYFDASELGAT